MRALARSLGTGSPSLWKLAVGLCVSGLMAGQLRAQALCSAPHSSPELAGGRGLRTLPQGSGWFQASGVRQVSERYFGTGGERRAFLAAGEVTTHALYLTAAVGLVPGVDLWSQVPVLAVRYADRSGERQATGIGDPRLAVRLGPQAWGIGLPVMVRGGLKLPGREFPVDATLIPLSEGQRDWEVSLESGATLGHRAAYLVGWAGYRWREENVAVQRKPGNERFAHLALGSQFHGVHAEAALQFLSGEAPRYVGVEVPSARRRLLQLQPTLAYPAGPGVVELTGLVSLAGRNLPSGPALSAGYRLAWGRR